MAARMIDAMTEPVHDYLQLVFATPAEARAAARALLDELAAAPPDLAEWRPHRVVVWVGSPDEANRTLFLSPLALAVLRCAVAALPHADVVAATALPPERGLLIGESRDWTDSGNRESPT